jgi:polyferredoxin
MDCVLCGECVDLEDPDVLSLIGRWDRNSGPGLEDAIHRECLRRALSRMHGKDG